MIRFYYSEDGQYNIQQLPDYDESLLFDESKQKLTVFGQKDFYFMRLSDAYSNASDGSIALSQKGAHSMYVQVETDMLNGIAAHNEQNLTKFRQLDTSIYWLDASMVQIFDGVWEDERVWAAAWTQMDISVHGINTSINLHDTSILDLIARVAALESQTTLQSFT